MNKVATKYVSDLVQNLQPSGIRKFFDLASQMEDVVSLGVGEPDFVTPWTVREAAILSMEKGYTAYTANAGLIELREKIAQYLHRQYLLTYCPKEEIIVTVGASQALDLAMRAIVNPGDEVIIIAPNFVSYVPLVQLAGGSPVVIETKHENGFDLLPEELEKAITDKTKAILLCSPNNPTGTVFNKERLLSISEVIKKHDLVVISDEIYSELIYEDHHVSIASIEGLRERTIVINGFSKGFAMTGWRLGYLCAPKEIASAVLKIHQYTMMCASTAAQFAAVEALENGYQQVEEMRKSYRLRRNYFVQSLNEIGLPCHVPGGAFYAFPSIAKTGLTSVEFAEKLLLEEKVAVVPGSVFGTGGEGAIRCSYASSMEQLQEAITRMKRFMQKYK